jgi:hypothetical protein
MAAAPALYIVKPPLSPAPPALRCAACGSDIGMSDPWWCDRCDAAMHEPCFWGRVASQAEWLHYLANWIAPEDCPDEGVPCLCPTCRQLDVLGPS